MKFCECEADGYCPRYNREMRGRFRQICQGIDVDLGTAARFREQWALEAAPAPSAQTVPVTLITDQAPGDALVMTAAIRSLHAAHPGRFATAVRSPHPDVFAYNPDVSPAVAGASELRMHYTAILRSCDRGIHFMQAWYEHLGMALGLHVPLAVCRPCLHFADPEPPPGDFWLVCAGTKSDFTAKRWRGYQAVVSSLKGAVRFVQVGSDADGHDHPHLYGAENLVGRTSLRELFALARAARGILCGVTLLMHVAAALDKPAVVIAGGREPVQWNAYPRQHYLHAVGLLGCPSWRGRAGEACWRSQLPPPHGPGGAPANTCVSVAGGQAACMGAVRPEDVAALIARYNAGVGNNNGPGERCQ